MWFSNVYDSWQVGNGYRNSEKTGEKETRYYIHNKIFPAHKFHDVSAGASEYNMCSWLKAIKNRQKQHRWSIQTVPIHQYRKLNLEEMYRKIKKGFVLSQYIYTLEQNKRILA